MQHELSRRRKTLELKYKFDNPLSETYYESQYQKVKLFYHLFLQDTRFRTKFLKIISLGLYNLQRKNRVEITHYRRPRLSIANIETLSEYKPKEQDQREEYKHKKSKCERKMIRNSKLKQINVRYFSSSLETTDV